MEENYGSSESVSMLCTKKQSTDVKWFILRRKQSDIPTKHHWSFFMQLDPFAAPQTLLILPKSRNQSCLHQSNSKFVGKIREDAAGRDQLLHTKIPSCRFIILSFRWITHENGLKGNFYQTLWWRWKDEKKLQAHGSSSQKLKLQNLYWNWNAFIVFIPHNEYISYLLSSYILHFFIHFFTHTSFHTYFFLTWRLVYLWIYLFSNIIR